MESILENKYDLYYKIMGEGKPIVFLHGWGMNHTMMLPIAKPLSENYQVICIDLFGFGNSHEIENYINFNEYIDNFHQFLLSLDIHKPVIIAHSFGARVAFNYAYKYPVEALILTGAAGIRSPLSIKKQIRQFLHKHKIIQSKGSIDYQKATPFLRKVLVECVNTDLSDMISAIKIPILLIWGEKDIETPLWMAKRIMKLNSFTSLVLFKGEDHFAYYHEPLRFIQCVNAFMEKL